MGRSSILVIDDDKRLANLLKEFLESYGYAVLVGHDGQVAIALARAQRPHLIIMDVDMPRMSGLQALNVIRQDAETQDIPVIMLTGVTSEEVYPQIAALPRVSHIKKPVSLEDLGSMVKHYIGDVAD